jgi:hypothetical protein
MESSSACNRIAATRLLTSCQSIGGNGESSEMDTSIALDRVKSLYAVRLAICELTGASAAIPPACSALYITPNQAPATLRSADVDNSGLENDIVQPAELDSCLKSLESRPQWWTSYSNSRQNAVVMCQAARTEVEKEELLELHRSLARNTVKLNHGLQEALRNAAAESARHEAFVEAADVMRTNLVRELEGNSLKARNAFSGFLYEIETAISSTVTGVMSLIKEIGEGTNALGKVRV